MELVEEAETYHMRVDIGKELANHARWSKIRNLMDV